MITGELHTRKRKIEFSGDNLGSGNVVPSHWYHSIVRPCGKSDTIAITILSEMVFLYRYNNQSQFQLNFHHFKSKFNFGLSQVKDAVIRLKQASLLKRCLRNITVLGRLFVNEMFLILNIENVLSLNKQLEAKKFAYSKGKDDTGCAEISTDNIEEKYLNKKSRSNESNFEKNFLKGGNDFIEAVDVTDSTISFTPTQFSLINPNPSQSLSAFHPLNKDDIEWLKVRSGRDFDMNFISTFIFLVPLLIFSGGMRSYIFYITAVASLQLWTPLNAVINMIIGTYSNLEPGSNMLMSFSTASTASNHIDTIVTVAAGLQTVVPFIAFAMMQGGISGMMHLAGSVIGGLQSTAGGIGSEVATGNRNMDNVSENNVSRHMLNANKTDTNMQYASGAQIAQLADGTTERINPDGSQVLSGGVGSTVSGGETTYHMSEDQTGQVSRGIQSQEAMVRSSQASLSEAESSTFAKTVDRVSSIAQRVHNGENMNFDRS
ncbi:MAG: conjugal transfer protein TraG N-terminal domain-containing protein, partial [Pseudomonadota bacterium]